MNKYEIVEPRKGRDGFYDETLPFMVFGKGLTAEEANRYMLHHLEYRYYARDMETGELYHCNTQGLKKYNPVAP